VSLDHDLSDDEIVERLGRLVRQHDPVPDAVVASARQAFAARARFEDVAELVYDSATDEELIGVRGGGRQLSFTGRTLTIELEALAGRRRVVGQVAPASGGEAAVRHRGGEVLASIDALGRFSADGIPAGPVSVRCRVDTGQGEVVTETEWVLL